MSIVLDGTSGITTPNVSTDTSTLGPLTQALNLGSTGQIVFPATQNASANASTLDDYEEGNWLPTLTASTSGTITVNSATSTCWYIKVGRIVHFGGRINTSAVNSPTGDLNLGNFPFASATVTNGQNQIAFSVSFNGLGTALSGPVSFFWPEGTTTCRLRDVGNATGSGGSIANKVDGSTQLFINGSYLAA